MRGRKPTPSNVVPLTGAKGGPRLTPAQIVVRLKPRGLTKDEAKEWKRVGLLLADPTVDRLKPHFVDSILEYCRAVIRLRMFRDYFANNKVELTEAEGVTENAVERVTGEGGLDAEMYVVHGRNGTQLKSHPFVAQMNEAQRIWHRMCTEIGMSVSAERNMMPGQGSLFDDPAEQYMGGGAG